MATSTTNLQLRKPAGSDFITVDTDLNANYDIIDKFAGPITGNHMWSGSRSVGNTLTSISNFTNDLDGNIASSDGTNFTLGRAGKWAIIARHHSDNATDYSKVVSLQWDSGPFNFGGINSLQDVMKSDIGFAGGGELRGNITWVGWVSSSQATQPFQIRVRTKNSTTTHNVWVLANYLGGEI